MAAPRMVGLATIRRIAIHSICLLGEELTTQGIHQLESNGWITIDGDLLIASALLAKGRQQEAFDKLTEAERPFPPSPAIFNAIGELRLASGNWQPATQVFAKSLQLDDEDPLAHSGMAQALLKLGNWPQAAEHSLRAVGLSSSEARQPLGS